MAKRGRPRKNKEITELERPVVENLDKKENIITEPIPLIENTEKSQELQAELEGKKEIKITPEQQEKKDKLKRIMGEVNKDFKDPAMLKFAKDEPAKESIPFGVNALDNFCGGGAVKGNFIIIYGSEGVGKTSDAYLQIAQIQRQGGIACLIDLEHSTEKERMKVFGVNVDELVLVENCETAEDAMNITKKLAKEKVVDLIVIDSVQALSPHDENYEGKGEKEKPMEKNDMALLARVMGKFLKRTASFVYKAKCAVILIGQVRTEGLGTFITRMGCTGGHALKHWSMLTLQKRKGQGVDAPVYKWKADGKTKEIRIGFSQVTIIEKTKKMTSQPENSELRIPFYPVSGYQRPTDEKIQEVYEDWIRNEENAG